MVLDFAAALLYIGIVWILGYWTSKRLFEDKADNNAYLLSFALGFSELTLVSTFLYFACKLPMEAIRITWMVLGCASLVDTLRRREVYKPALAVLGGVTVLWVVMLIPGIVGKDQYYVYRGNCTDQQTYVEETVALSMHPLGWYESRTEDEVGLVSDVLWRGYRWAVKDRPSAGTMIAVLRLNPSGEIYWVVYMYRMFVLAICMPTFLYLFGVVLGGDICGFSVQKLIWILAAALYCIGFWGQIQYDIDAVSQISAIAVLTALTAEFLCYAQGLMDDAAWDRGRYLTMILLASAGLALYLESALVHAALYLVTGILLLVRRKKRLTWRQGAQVIGIPAISFGILILVNYRIIHFFVKQINTSVSDGRQAWANYFNKWWLGRYGIDEGRITGPVSGLVNYIVSASGMYSMTVNYERYYGVTAIALTGLTALLALLVILCILRPFVKKQGESVWLLWVVMMTGLVIFIGMCVGGKYWSAGKLLYYISPYLYTFLCIPVLRFKECKDIIEKLALLLAVILLFSNVEMVYEKCRDVRVNTAGLGYRGTYPSDMIAGLKMTTDFTFDTDRLEGVDSVVIRDLSMVSDHQFYLQYLKTKLTCAEIPFIPENDIDYYQDAVEVSQKRVLTGNTAALEAEKNVDGRYEIVIR